MGLIHTSTASRWPIHLVHRTSHLTQPSNCLWPHRLTRILASSLSSLVARRLKALKSQPFRLLSYHWGSTTRKQSTSRLAAKERPTKRHTSTHNKFYSLNQQWCSRIFWSLASQSMRESSVPPKQRIVLVSGRPPAPLPQQQLPQLPHSSLPSPSTLSPEVCEV